MPRRGGVKVKKMMPKGSADDADLLNDMFSQMTGAENADPDIIIPKLCTLHNLLSKYSKIYQLLLNFSEFIDNFPEHKASFLEIVVFIEKIEKLVGTDNALTETALRNSSADEVNTLYKKLKNTKEVQTIVTISGNLGKYQRYLSDKDNLGDEFIKREPGLSLKPITFTNLDLKILWSSDKLSVMAKKYILNILSHTYIIGHKMYQTITSPDVDIKKFSKVLIDNIDKMKKQIPRCNKAFDIIAKSVSLLENKFEGYYKTSVEAENPSIIIESFIIDVSMSQKANASITSQFRKIIMFMKRQSANSKDPRVSKLFKILNSQFSMMQQETGIDPESDDEAKPKETTSDPSDPSDQAYQADRVENSADEGDMNEMASAMEELMGSMMTEAGVDGQQTDSKDSADDIPDLTGESDSDVVTEEDECIVHHVDEPKADITVKIEPGLEVTNMN